MDDETFHHLMTRTREEDRDATGALLVQAFEPVRATLVRGMDPLFARGGVEPEDIIQEAYAAAWPRMREQRFDGFPALVAWLRTIAENKLIDARRKLLADKRDVRRNLSGAAGMFQSYSDLLHKLAAESSTPSRKVARKEAVAIMMVQLAQLPEDYRRVIQWRVIQGISVQEVAGMLDRSEDAVHMLCYRALRKLGELIGRSGGPITDA